MITWTIYRMMRRFLPETHSWKHHPITFVDWYPCRTRLCRHFDIVLGITGGLFLVAITKLLLF